MTAASPNRTSAPAPPSKAATKRFDKRKEEILRAAVAVINRLGLREATLAVIAAEIGLNLKSLRYYYEKREDLVEAAFERSIELHRRIAEAALAEASTADRLRVFVQDYFHLRAQVRLGEQPEFVHFGNIRSLTEPHRSAILDRYNDLFRAVRRLFGRQDPSCSPDQRNANAHFLISQLLWSVVWADNYAPADLPRVADRMTDILLHGLAGRPFELPTSPPIKDPFSATDALSRDSFLQATTQLINDIGYRGTSVDRISALLNVTKGSFYHHNESRDELVVRCFERSFAIIREAQDSAVGQPGDRLLHIALSSSALVTRQMLPGGDLLRTSALTAINPSLRIEMERRLSLSTGRFADMLNDGLIDGSVRLCDVRIAAEMVTAMINAAQELGRWARGATANNADDLFVRPLLHGLLACSQTASPPGRVSPRSTKRTATG